MAGLARAAVFDLDRLFVWGDHAWRGQGMEAFELPDHEKQRLTEENSLDSNMRSMIQKLYNWVESLQNLNKDHRREMFPTLDEK